MERILGYILAIIGFVLLYIYSFSIYGRVGGCSANRMLLDKNVDDVTIYYDSDRDSIVFVFDKSEWFSNEYRCRRIGGLPLFMVYRWGFRRLESVESGSDRIRLVLLAMGFLLIGAGIGLIVSPGLVPFYVGLSGALGFLLVSYRLY